MLTLFAGVHLSRGNFPLPNAIPTRRASILFVDQQSLKPRQSTEWFVDIASVDSNDAVVLQADFQELARQRPDVIKLLASQFVAFYFRVDAKLEENFCAVDISNSGDDTLIQQQATDCLSGLCDLLPGSLWIGVTAQRIGADAVFQLFELNI